MIKQPRRRLWIALFILVIGVGGFLLLIQGIPSRFTFLRELRAHTGLPYYLDFSPDGQFLVTGSNWDHSVRLWRVADGKLLLSVAFSPGGKFLVAGIDSSKIFVWDLVDGKLVQRLSPACPVGLAFSPDGQWLVGCDWRTNKACIYRTSDWKLVPQLTPTPPYAQGVSFSDGGQSLYCWGHNAIYSWRKSGAEFVPGITIGRRTFFRGADLSPDGQWIAIAESWHLSPWRAKLIQWVPPPYR